MLFRALSEKADKAMIATKLWTLSIFPDRQGPVANNCVQTMVRHRATSRAFPADLGQLIVCINIAGCEHFIRNGVVSCQFMWCMFKTALNVSPKHFCYIIVMNSNINTYKYIVLYLHQYS